MKRLLITFFISLSTIIAGAQKIYFVYLQTENRQPFYVKLNDKIFSSSASGYIILSKLPDSLYKISVGFPQGKWPEQKFSIDMRGKDHGYLLKNFEDGSWGLLDLQTMAMQIAPAEGKTGKTGSGAVSRFTEVLAMASNDPSLLEKPVVVKQEQKPMAPQQAALTETETVKNPPKSEAMAVTSQEKEKVKENLKPPVVKDYRRSVVTKKSESSTTAGFGLVFIDEYADGKKDTISIIIPPVRKENAVKESPGEKKEFLDFETPVSGAQRMPFRVPGKNFLATASENDFLDVKGKFGFLNVVHDNVFDPGNFENPQVELKSEYYIHKSESVLK